jgi:hypothetical protein
MQKEARNTLSEASPVGKAFEIDSSIGDSVSIHVYPIPTASLVRCQFEKLLWAEKYALEFSDRHWSLMAVCKQIDIPNKAGVRTSQRARITTIDFMIFEKAASTIPRDFESIQVLGDYPRVTLTKLDGQPALIWPTEDEIAPFILTAPSARKSA